MADSDGEYVDNMSDDEYMDHQVTSSRGAGASRTRAAGSTRKKARKDKRSRAKWEEVSRSWDLVEEGEDGMMQSTIDEVREHEKRMRLLRDTTPLQRGIIRHLVLVLDMSFAVLEKDMLPTRYRVMMNYAAEFVKEFFEQNPISQLGILAMTDGKAVRISDVCGSVEQHLAALGRWRDADPGGNPSLQNALEMCRGVLYHAPSHGTREVLIVYGALLTIDPGDIHDTISALITDRIRVSIVGLSAQVAICQELCSRTNAGDDSQYIVATNADHFQSLLLAATTPPVARTREHACPNLLQMGFPSRTLDRPDAAVMLCVCHNQPHREGYRCTRCGAKVCKLPVECPSCGLTLIMSTHLARSYHHMFPLPMYREVGWEDARQSGSVACFACHHAFPIIPTDKGRKKSHATKVLLQHHGGGGGQGGGRWTATKMVGPGDDQEKTISNGDNDEVDVADEQRHENNNSNANKEGVSESGRYACTLCGMHFCIDCDVYAHEVIHNCPGCLSLSPSVRKKRAAPNGASGKMRAVNDNGSGNGNLEANVLANGGMILD